MINKDQRDGEDRPVEMSPFWLHILQLRVSEVGQDVALQLADNSYHVWIRTK